MDRRGEETRGKGRVGEGDNGREIKKREGEGGKESEAGERREEEKERKRGRKEERRKKGRNEKGRTEGRKEESGWK